MGLSGDINRAVVRITGGGGGQTIGTAPNAQERGGYEVDFWGWGEGNSGEVAGAGKRQLLGHPNLTRYLARGIDCLLFLCFDHF